jgi:hypothetical protein
MTDLTPTDPGRVLDLFGPAEEIEITTRRADGTLRGYVPIWVVAVDGGLYVRSYRGGDGAWYRHATGDPFGAIRFGSHQVEATFGPAGRDIRTAVAATLRVVPQN